MVLCTECYIQKDGKTLMMHRNKKQKDINAGKWIGVGGKFLPGESPEQCLLREVAEETGVGLIEFRMRGIITFCVTEANEEPILIFVFTASAFEGQIRDCDEGTLAWIPNEKILQLNLWEGDRLFWNILLSGDDFFSMRLVYDGNKLIAHDEKLYPCPVAISNDTVSNGTDG